MTKNAIDILYSRPGMYLGHYDGIDAGGFIISLLSALFESQELNIPNHIDITVAEQHFIMQVNGCDLSQIMKMKKIPNLKSIFDISNFREPFLMSLIH